MPNRGWFASSSVMPATRWRRRGLVSRGPSSNLPVGFRPSCETAKPIPPSWRSRRPGCWPIPPGKPGRWMRCGASRPSNPRGESPGDSPDSTRNPAGGRAASSGAHADRRFPPSGSARFAAAARIGGGARPTVGAIPFPADDAGFHSRSRSRVPSRNGPVRNQLGGAGCLSARLGGRASGAAASRPGQRCAGAPAGNRPDLRGSVAKPPGRNESRRRSVRNHRRSSTRSVAGGNAPIRPWSAATARTSARRLPNFATCSSGSPDYWSTFD